MSRALILCGSANPDGVTVRMCQAAGSELVSMGYEVTRMGVSEEVGHCTDCGACRNGPCIIEDGMSRIYDEFSKADLLVLATPIHFSGPSSVMKTIIDRFQPYWFDRDLPHPTRVVALMCGGSPEPRFDPTVRIFRAFSVTIGMEWLGHCEVKDTDNTLGEGSEAIVSTLIRSVIGNRSGR